MDSEVAQLTMTFSSWQSSTSHQSRLSEQDSTSPVAYLTMSYISSINPITLPEKSSNSVHQPPAVGEFIDNQSKDDFCKNAAAPLGMLGWPYSVRWHGFASAKRLSMEHPKRKFWSKFKPEFCPFPAIQSFMKTMYGPHATKRLLWPQTATTV